jgi:hypothetical protein
LKSWAKNTGEMGQELFETYPAFVQSGTKLLPLRNISKRFHSLEEFFFHYSTTIGHRRCLYTVMYITNPFNCWNSIFFISFFVFW